MTRRGLVGTLSATVLGAVIAQPRVAFASYDRGASNERALFKDDIYYETGKVPNAVFDPANDALTYPFISSEKRQIGYRKNAPRVQKGIEAYNALAAKIDDMDWAGVKTACARPGREDGSAGERIPPGPVYSGVLASGVLASALLVGDRSGVERSTYLCRFYVNEIDSACIDLLAAAEAKDQKRARAAWENGVLSWNSLRAIVNPVISDKVGDQLVEAGRPPAPPPAAAPPADAPIAAGDLEQPAPPAPAPAVAV